MPYKFEKLKLKIRPEDDKRRKLSDEDKKEIHELYESGTISINALSRKYNVSKRLIQFILFPERQKKTDNKKYYDTEKNREYKKRHRYHKKQLYDKGKLEE